MNNETASSRAEVETHKEWIESEKKRLTAINGLDPVEELLVQLGICQHSNSIALRGLEDAYNIHREFMATIKKSSLEKTKRGMKGGNKKVVVKRKKK